MSSALWNLPSENCSWAVRAMSGAMSASGLSGGCSFGGVALLDRGLSYSQSLSPMESYITYQMFSYMNLGYASALAWIMFILVMVIMLFLFSSARYWVHFPEESSDDEI
jgi:hypothetical protein